MSEEPQPSKGLKTAADVIAAIPEEWRDAVMFIANGIGDIKRIKRVALHLNHEGKKAVVIYDDDFNK